MLATLVLASLVIAAGLHVRSARSDSLRLAQQGQRVTLTTEATARLGRQLALSSAVERQLDRYHRQLGALVTSDARSDRQLARQRHDAARRLLELAARLRRTAAAPLPADADALPDAVVDPVFSALADQDVRAASLADAVERAVERSGSFADAAAGLRAAAHRYAEHSRGMPEESDPDELVTVWRKELELLGDYASTARRAKRVDSLAPLAEAHLTYVSGARDFAHRAIELLEDGDLDRYNERLAAAFDEDPFGFARELERATPRVVQDGVLERLRTLRHRVLGYRVDARRLSEALPSQLAPRTLDSDRTQAS